MLLLLHAPITVFKIVHTVIQDVDVALIVSLDHILSPAGASRSYEKSSAACNMKMWLLIRTDGVGAHVAQDCEHVFSGSGRHVVELVSRLMFLASCCYEAGLCEDGDKVSQKVRLWRVRSKTGVKLDVVDGEKKESEYWVEVV